MAEYKRVCNFCYKDFIAQKFTTKFCSNRCASLSYKVKVRQDRENMFNDNEIYKKLLFQIAETLEKVEIALNLRTSKNEFSDDELITVDEFCEIENIHKRTLSRMIKREEVKVVRHLNRIFIPKNQLRNNR